MALRRGAAHARDATRRLARRRRGERDRPTPHPEAGPYRPAEQIAIDRERAEALHAEIDRLPGPFRLAVVLCCLEGLPLSEAARRLRCPAGTVHSRLDRAKEKLRIGLLRRGFAMSTTAVAALLAPRSASASVPPLLCDSTTRAAIAFAARHAAGGALSASAAAMAREVLRSMLIHKLKTATLAALLIAALAAGAASLSVNASARPREGEPRGEPQSRAARTEPRPPDESPPPATGRMIVTGRVLGPDGKPAAGVPVEFIGRRREAAVALRESGSPYAVLGRSTTGADGRFRIEATRTSSDGFTHLQAIASVPGVGLGWAVPDPDAEQIEVEIRLRPEQLIRGKLMDLSGRPAAGVAVGVSSIEQPGPYGRKDWIGGERPAGLLNWPRPVRTDDQGRFTIAGVGREMTAYLGIRDPRFATRSLLVRTNAAAGPIEVTRALEPATVVEGRALAADTGLPIPHAIVSLGSSLTPFFSGAGHHFPADDQGRFSARATPGDYYSIRGYPPDGSPYLISEHRFNWTKGAVKRTMDVTVPRGVLIRGQVVEAGTGRPLAGASVQFHANPQRDDIVSGWHAIVASGDDGSFRIAVPPGRGHLLVYGHTSDYILREIGWRELQYGRPGGWRTYAHAILAYEVNAGDASSEIVAALRPGKTIRGRVLDPDGRPVKEATIMTRLDAGDTHAHWNGAHQLHARNGRFELHGLGPETSAPVIFLDADHERARRSRSPAGRPARS